MIPHADQKYLVALVENNEPLIKEIYQHHSADVKRYVLQNSGTIEDAKDLFQEVLLELLRMTAKGFTLRKPLKGYLSGMCRYKWIDKLNGDKKNRQRMRVTISGNNREYIEMEEELKTVFRKEKMHALFLEKYKTLAPHCQEIIGLRSTKNETSNKLNSLKEIAAMLDRSYGYIRKEISNCMKKLIQIIKSDVRYMNL